MRIFGGDAVAKIMGFLKIPENEPIEHSMVSKAIEQAQVKVEGFNFDARKNVVEYDDVMNKQREIIYGLRHRVLNGEITDDEITVNLKRRLENIVTTYAPHGIVESEVAPIVTALVEVVPFDDASQSNMVSEFKRLGTAKEITALIGQIISDTLAQRKSQVGESDWKNIVKYAYLSSIDNLWIDHLDAVDDLRSGIGLRGYGQRDPLVEYKGEAFSMFERLHAQIDTEFSKRLFRIQIGPQPPTPIPTTNLTTHHPQPVVPQTPSGDFMSALSGLQKTAVVNKNKTLGRNDPCPCGSGKKWKRCHYPNIP